MARHCEVCDGFRPRPARGAPVKMQFSERAVTLCAGHARIARSLGVIKLAELRALYAENGGRRSFVQRRAKRRAGATGRRSADV